jgi:TonB family protein
MIGRLGPSALAVAALLACAFPPTLEAQPRPRPFETLADGRVVFATGDSSTITVGPMPEALAARQTMFVIAAIEAVRVSGYPAMLRDAGIGGTVMVGLYVHWSGQVHQTRIDETSGHESLDQAALLVASAMGFGQVPPGSPLTVEWVSIPVRFQVG